MTTTAASASEPSAEAVALGAEALAIRDGFDALYADAYRADARAVLSAALPTLEAAIRADEREKVARVIESVIESHDPDPHENWCRVCDDGEPYGEHIARIARGSDQ